VDRKALPAPTEADLPGHQEFVAPRTPLEETLTAIFGEVLGLERVGVLDDFFDLGGHSLLATQLVSRIRESVSGSTTLADIFDAPSVALLAERLADAPVPLPSGADVDVSAMSDDQVEAMLRELLAQGGEG
jgi:hypothetical protein